MRSRLTASLATIAVTSATLLGGAAAASAQPLPPLVPQHVVDGLVSQARAALPAEVWTAVGSSDLTYRDVSGGLREGITNEINGYRAAHGLATLGPAPHLDREAQAWADRLAAEDDVYHNTELINRGHGENIVAAGVHCTAVCLVDLWKNSPGHNANLLEPDYRTAGMGVAYSANGQVFVVHNFAYH